MKTGAHSETITSDYPVAYKIVRVCQGRIRLNIEEFFRNGNDKVKDFLGKVARTPAVTRVKFSSATKTVVIHYIQDTFKPQDILNRVINSGPTQETDEGADHHLEIILNYTISKKGGDLELLKINRYGDLVTTWKIKRDVPGRIRLRNPFLLQNRRLAQRLDCELEKTTEQSRKHLNQIFGKHVRFAYLLKDGKETQVPVETLKENDIISVRTGEQIPDYTGVLPHEKAEYVRLLQKEGKKVMMVGDGVNDSVALSCADIGISISGASTIAVDVSDVVFMDGDLRKFDYLFDISDAFNRNVRRSFIMILIPNTICIVGAFFRIFGL